MPKVATKYLIPQFIFSHFGHHVCTGVLVPLLPLLREVFGLNYFQSGILISSFSLSYGFGQVPMAILADRFSRRLIIILGLLGISLAGISISLTQDFRQMVPFLMVMGLLGGTYHAPASSFISQVLPPDKRGRALGMHFTGGSASFFLTPAMALGIATLFDSWRSSFFILALPALLAGTILWLTTEEPQDNVASQTEKKNNHDSTSDEAQISWMKIIRTLGLLVSLTIFLNIVFASVNAYMPLYMVDHHNISPRWAGIVVSVISGAGIIGAPPWWSPFRSSWKKTVDPFFPFTFRSSVFCSDAVPIRDPSPLVLVLVRPDHECPHADHGVSYRGCGAGRPTHYRFSHLFLPRDGNGRYYHPHRRTLHRYLWVGSCFHLPGDCSMCGCRGSIALPKVYMRV